ncbi:MAG: peroxiredoxin family protein [Gemmataceae bacterium]
MGETLHQPPQGRRFKLAPMHIAFLLLVPAAGLGLFAGTRARVSEPRPLGSESGNHSLTVAAPMPSLQEILTHPDLIPTHDHPLVGRQAPDFALADAEGKAWNLRELRAGGSLVLIFYYGYHCPKCVRQLGDVNRDVPLFREVGARVVALSADPPELTRRRFEQYGRFDFLVLSDAGNKVAHAYQVFKADFLRHGIFLIDRDGTVTWVNVGDAPFRRNSALLSHLAKLKGRSPFQVDPRTPVTSPAPRMPSEPAAGDGRDCGVKGGFIEGAKRTGSPQR